jgi:predicted GIY-YIG superfamily endonuclease
MIKSGIYLIKHKTEESLVYVGKSVNIHKRWKQHINGFRSAKKLQEAFSEYGIESFEFQILEEINDSSEMGSRETYYIDLYNSWKNGLNGSRAGGEWGRHARSFVKNYKGFKSYNGTELHSETSKRAGSVGGLRAKSNVYKMHHNGQVLIFVGTSIISQYLGINQNTLRNWATTGKRFKVFSGSSIEILGKASKLPQYAPNVIYQEVKSGELLEVFRRVSPQKVISSQANQG